ncbi:hypothetical protein GmHk_03G007805 [Glycine max]|nr:hypothetical protein GmHk_03G007805 [Glycine max]
MKQEAGHSGSAPPPSRLSTLNEKLEMVLATLPKLTNEEHEQCCKMAKIMLKFAVPLDTILNTVNIYGEVSRSFVVRWKDVLDRLWHFIDKDGNFHTVVYNQDLDKSAIIARWTTLRDFYHLTGDHQVYLTPHKVTCSNLDIPSTMYYFLKDKGWTYLHLEDVAECRLLKLELDENTFVKPYPSKLV